MPSTRRSARYKEEQRQLAMRFDEDEDGIDIEGKLFGGIREMADQFAEEDLLLVDNVRSVMEKEHGDLKTELSEKDKMLAALQAKVQALEGNIKQYKNTSGTQQHQNHGDHSNFGVREITQRGKVMTHRLMLLLASDSEGHRRKGEGEVQLSADVIRAQQELATMRHLCLSGVGMKQPELRRLCRQLRWLPSVSSVDLSNNSITDVASEDLATIFKQQLQSINLSRNHLGQRSINVIVNSLTNNQYLEMLDLSANPFCRQPKTGSLICNALKTNVTLWHLAISASDYVSTAMQSASSKRPSTAGGESAYGNNKPVGNGIALSSLPRKQTDSRKQTDQQGRFYTNVRQPRGAAPSLPRRRVGGVISLQLGFNHLSTKCAHNLGQHLGALTALDLRYGYIGTTGGRHLAAGLSASATSASGLAEGAAPTAHPRLTWLNLSHNSLCDSGASAILRHLLGNDHLTHLDLSSNSITSNFHQERRNIAATTVGRHRSGDVGGGVTWASSSSSAVAALGKLLSFNKVLTIHCTHFTLYSLYSLSFNKVLTRVDLSRNPIDDRALGKLADLLEQCQRGGAGAVQGGESSSGLSSALQSVGDMDSMGLSRYTAERLDRVFSATALAMGDSLTRRLNKKQRPVHVEVEREGRAVGGTGMDAWHADRKGLLMKAIRPVLASGWLRVEWTISTARKLPYEWTLTRRKQRQEKRRAVDEAEEDYEREMEYEYQHGEEVVWRGSYTDGVVQREWTPLSAGANDMFHDHEDEDEGRDDDGGGSRRRASRDGATDGARRRPRAVNSVRKFETVSNHWSEGDQLALWVRPSPGYEGPSGGKIFVGDMVVSTEGDSKHNLLYQLVSPKELIVKLDFTIGGCGVDLPSGHEYPLGFVKVHKISCYCSGALRLHWEGKLVDFDYRSAQDKIDPKVKYGVGRPTSFAWVVTRGMSSELVPHTVIAQGVCDLSEQRRRQEQRQKRRQQEGQAGDVQDDGYMEVETVLAVGECHATEQLAIWVGPFAEEAAEEQRRTEEAQAEFRYMNVDGASGGGGDSRRLQHADRKWGRITAEVARSPVQVAHLRNLSVYLDKPVTVDFSATPTLNFSSERPFAAPATASWF
jgi:hypothetical protein